MTLTTLRASPAHRQIFLDRHFGPALYRAPAPPPRRHHHVRPRTFVLEVSLDLTCILLSLALIFILRKVTA